MNHVYLQVNELNNFMHQLKDALGLGKNRIVCVWLPVQTTELAAPALQMRKLAYPRAGKRWKGNVFSPLPVGLNQRLIWSVCIVLWSSHLPGASRASAVQRPRPAAAPTISASDSESLADAPPLSHSVAYHEV